LQLADFLAKLERKVIRGRRLCDDRAETSQSVCEIERRAEVEVPGRTRVESTSKMQRKAAFYHPRPIAGKSIQESLDCYALLKALGRQPLRLSPMIK
jgi:hypothetical protein